jgi:hydroxymethylbilane synthase
MQGVIRLGTRGSALALAQARWVTEQLAARWPGLMVELVVIQTVGDHSQAGGVPLAAIGGQGVFVKEIEHALLRREIDLAAHSLKDMATRLEPGLVLAAVPPREDARDALISRHGVGLAELPPAPRIGTSSPRRAAQVRAARPDAAIVNLRGNLDTRLRKAATDDYDAIVVAAAGLHRLGRAGEITAYLPLDQFIPMVGQAALGLEARADDAETLRLLRPLDDPATHAAARAERAYLAALGSGCSAPVAAHAVVAGEALTLHAMISDPDGRRVVRDADAGAVEAAEIVGRRLAERLMAAGGGEIIAATQGRGATETE